MMSSQRKVSNKRDLRAIHEALSLTTLAMVALHGVSLLGDAFLNPGLAGIAVPFAGAYRPLWTGLGIVAGYGLAVLGALLLLPRSDRRRPLAPRSTGSPRSSGCSRSATPIGAGSDAAELWFLLASGALVVPAALLLALRWISRTADARAELQYRYGDSNPGFGD